MESNKIALLFPGQNIRYEGMGRDVYNKFPTARIVYEKAEDILKVRLIFNPKNKLIRAVDDLYQKHKLTNTEYTQLLVFVTNHAFYEVLKEKVPKLRYDVAAGHSLGEYNAALVAGALRFEDALKLVQRRGQHMHRVSSKVNGGLVALVGKNGEELDTLAKSLENRGIYIALINTPQQIVVGGPNAELERVIKELGPKSAKKVDVEGPFHTTYMKPAAEQIKDDLGQIDFKLASIPIVANTSARFIVDPKDIEEELNLQLSNPVRWRGSIERMFKQGFTTYIVIGADKYNTIKNLVQQTTPNAKIVTVKDEESLDNISTRLDKLS